MWGLDVGGTSAYGAARGLLAESRLSSRSRERKSPSPPLPSWDRSPFFLVQEVVWNYGAGVAGHKFYSPRNEKFLWYVKHELD